MKSKPYILSIFVLFLWNALPAQDTTKQVIRKVFYEKKVSDIIFFDYKGEGEWPFRLPDGKFAFIIPDTTFEKAYPDVFYQLALAWGEEKMLSIRTFISEPQGVVFVKNDIFSYRDLKLYIIFEQIEIAKTSAIVVFHTTS